MKDDEYSIKDRVSSINWPQSFEEAKVQQEEQCSQINTSGPLQGVKLVAGVDMSHGEDSSLLHSAIVVMRAHNFEIVEKVYASLKANFPYVPGYLSYREGPVLVEAMKKLKSQVDLWFFDGQGLAHPRGFGLACHMGLLLDAPSIGVAKKKYVGEHDEPGQRAGNRKPLIFEGKQVGDALRTRNRVSPVYVSPGHNISMKEATHWTLRMVKIHRVPEPTRQAHIYVNQYRRECEGGL